MQRYAIEQKTEKGVDFHVLTCSESNRRIEACISLSNGANLCRLSSGGLPVIDFDAKELLCGQYTGTPVMYPTPNRVENGAFIWQGKSFIQRKRGTPVLIHGLVHDEPFTLLDARADENGAVLLARIEFTERDFFDCFPYKHSLDVGFRLVENALKISYDIHNRSPEPLPYGFGLHPYFQKLSGDATLIEVPVGGVMDMTDELLPTGAIHDVEGTIFDLRTPVSINDIDFDHVFLREGAGSIAYITYPEQKLRVSIGATDDFSHYVVYSPKGKHFFCIESQTCSTNAHNLYAKGFRRESGLKLAEAMTRTRGEATYRIEQL